MVNTKNIRKSICQIGKILYDRKLTDASGGNISVRDGDRVYINPRGSGYNHQWELEEDQIIITDLCRIPLIGSAEESFADRFPSFSVRTRITRLSCRRSTFGPRPYILVIS